jgi:hypothetical protein
MWWIVAVFVATLVLAYAFMPKPQTQAPPGTSEITAPTAEVGREIGVLFGTRDVEGMNCVWWGDVRLVAIKSKSGSKK